MNDECTPESEGLRAVAAAIMPPGAIGQDACGGYTASLTEAVMGVTKALMAIASAIERVADHLEAGDEE